MAEGISSMKAKGWVVQYGVAIILALLLGVILGNIPLFTGTTLGTAKLKASDVAQFLGYGGALLMFWLFGRRAAIDFPEEWKGFAPFREMIMPAATLIVVTVGYGVLLLICGPFLGKTGKTVYNWLFVAGIVAAAIWLVVTWFLKSAPLLASPEIQKKGKRQPA
jgi:peptidoglycan/LPS O-acetylase OafA/YrhL